MTTENTKDIESTESDAVEAAVPTIDDIKELFDKIKDFAERYDDKIVCAIAIRAGTEHLAMQISSDNVFSHGKTNIKDLEWMAATGFMKHGIFVTRGESPEETGKGIALMIEHNNERSNLVRKSPLLELLKGRKPELK